MDKTVKASERYALISAAIGVAVWLDIMHWFPTWSGWVGFIAGLLIAGSLNTQLLRYEADQRVADGGATPQRSLKWSIIWAMAWFALLYLPVRFG